MATMGDIAKKAGVSLSTVSYVLSGERPISEATRQKVLATMAELDYRPNALARGLASRRSRIIALVAGDAGHGFGATEMAIVQAASLAARARGYHLVFWTEDDPEGLAVLAGQGLVDGVLLMEVRLGDNRIAVLEKAGLPVTCIGRAHHDGTESSVPWVDIDYTKTISLAIEWLYQARHRNIILINQSLEAKAQGYGPAIRIGSAYKYYMEQYGLEAREIPAVSHAAGGLAALAEIRAEGNIPSAILVMNDRAVPGLLKGLNLGGCKVPDDVSVMSLLSSASMAELSVPALSSMEIPAEDLGRLGIESLLEILDPGGNSGGRIDSSERLVPCRLVCRESTHIARLEQ